MAVHLTSSGLSMPASQSASGDVNTLDDYEEGTFTPAALSYDGTLNNLAGHYVVVGKLSTGSCSMNIASGASDNSHFFISGLPFDSENTSYDRFGGYFTRIGNQGATSNLTTTFLHKQNFNQMGFATTGQNIGVAFSYFKAT